MDAALLLLHSMMTNLSILYLSVSSPSANGEYAIGCIFSSSHTSVRPDVNGALLNSEN